MKKIDINVNCTVTLDVIEPEYTDLYNPEDSIKTNLVRIMADKFPNLTVVSAENGSQTWAEMTVSGKLSDMFDYLEEYFYNDNDEAINLLASAIDSTYDEVLAALYPNKLDYEVVGARIETILDEAGFPVNGDYESGLLFIDYSDANDAKTLLRSKGYNVWTKENDCDEDSMFVDFEYTLDINEDEPFIFE